MKGKLRIALSLLLLLTLCLSTATAGGRQPQFSFEDVLNRYNLDDILQLYLHEDEALGFSFFLPKDWRQEEDPERAVYISPTTEGVVIVGRFDVEPDRAYADAFDAEQIEAWMRAEFRDYTVELEQLYYKKIIEQDRLYALSRYGLFIGEQIIVYTYYVCTDARGALASVSCFCLWTDEGEAIEEWFYDVLFENVPEDIMDALTADWA